MAYNSGQVNITISSTDLYIGIVVLGILAAVLGFLTHTIPSWAGFVGVAAAVISIVQYLVDEFVPATAWEYLTVTVIAAVVGEAGSLAGVQYVSLGVVLVWALAILSAVYNAVSQNGGSFLNSQQSTLFLGATGVGISFLTWWAGDPNATLAVIVGTLVTTVAQFLRVSVAQTKNAIAAAPSAKPA
jgi:hypothetical protein